jgi:hypothetical protein
MSKRMTFKAAGTVTIAAAIALCACAPSWASLVADGVTYTLLESTISPTEDQFTLEISGINGTSDTEKGRYGVASFAFGQPTPGSVVNGTSTGFAFMTGGLNAMGCDGSGNFYCFKANTKPAAPALPANSQLSFTFDVMLSPTDAGDFAGYDPAFKIGWAGTNKNYDLVSQTLTPTPVPLPAALSLLFSGIAGLGFFRRRKTA